MASFLVEGGHQLTGEITPQGAKNEALQVICATLLTAEEVKISNIPEILDVANLLDLLRQMGVRVDKLCEWRLCVCVRAKMWMALIALPLICPMPSS